MESVNLENIPDEINTLIEKIKDLEEANKAYNILENFRCKYMDILDEERKVAYNGMKAIGWKMQYMSMDIKDEFEDVCKRLSTVFMYNHEGICYHANNTKDGIKFVVLEKGSTNIIITNIDGCITVKEIPAG